MGVEIHNEMYRVNFSTHILLQSFMECTKPITKNHTSSTNRLTSKTMICGDEMDTWLVDCGNDVTSVYGI